MTAPNAIQSSLNGKTFQITLSAAAAKALDQLERPLLVEMELYFSCLIRKQVRFHPEGNTGDDAIAVGDKLLLRFHPVMTEACHSSIHDGPPPMSDFPIANDGFTPRWLKLDYKQGEWQGEYGWNV